MRKRRIFQAVFVLIIAALILISPAFCDDGDLIKQQLDMLDTDDMQSFIDQINRETDGSIPLIDIKQTILGIFKGNPIVNIKNLLTGMGRYFIKEVILNFNLMGKIIVLAIFCAVLQNLHSAFEGDTVGKLAYNICYMLIIIISIKSFYTAMKLGSDAIDTMVSFMQSLIPTLLALLVSVGGITSSTVFQPIVFGSISVITTFIKVAIIPMIFLSAVLSILNNLTEQVNVSRLAGLIRQTAVGLLGLILTIFLGIMSVQGVAASSLDSVTVKTAKFAVDNFIPIVGKFLTDALDTVVSCSMLIKNGIGVVGLLVLVIICSVPLLKMFSIIVIYKLSSALIQPILDNQIVQCLNDMSNSLLILLASVIAVGVLFFIAITVIMGAGNMTVMMR
ncbi:MAG: stage III sporulation protein AE [Bacillota bacterium]